jgi:hypothetical protein
MNVISFPFISLRRFDSGPWFYDSGCYSKKEETTDKLPPRLNLKSVMPQNSIPFSV